ncbi:helix-turn-helix transcriptional regulator [Empedobacter falsenii]|uniref:helix-turn-helix domain-containing protein n=1 Tax=Empedobacter falsenii TaxID=343874 RepID=UPI002576203F|nr:helix-turn-helix transcriptional regulator [Empedobacter falsenii]MDM1063624.1 helix-turn-helix transcriptional regulator [Empedobacter falsenii]
MFDFITIKDVKNNIGQWCKKMRKSEKLTQEELANELGLSRYTIVNLENGENTTLETLLKVLHYFDKMNSLNQFISNKIEDLDNSKSMY